MRIQLYLMLVCCVIVVNVNMWTNRYEWQGTAGQHQDKLQKHTLLCQFSSLPFFFFHFAKKFVHEILSVVARHRQASTAAIAPLLLSFQCWRRCLSLWPESRRDSARSRAWSWCAMKLHNDSAHPTTTSISVHFIFFYFYSTFSAIDASSFSINVAEGARWRLHVLY